MPTKKTASKTKTQPVSIEFNVGEFETMKDFVKYLASPKKLILFNFLAGTARGLGFILGATFFIALTGYVLSQYLVNIPFLGELFSQIDQWLQLNLDTY